MSGAGLDVRTVPIAKVQPWKDNPRAIKRSDYDRLKRQVIELGMYKPLVATSDGNGGYVVIGGNMRLRVLKDIGATDVAITLVKAPTDDLKLKYALSDNDPAGAWDEQLLAELAYKTKDTLGDLGLFKLNLAPPVNLGRVLDSFGPSEDPLEDKVPQADPEPITRPGDAFTLGRHRVVCGDAGKLDDLERLLQGQKADMVFTDPPGDNPLGEAGAVDLVEAWTGAIQRGLKKGGVFYVCTHYGALPAFLYAIKKTGLTLSNVIVWIRASAPQSRTDYRPKHDTVLRGSNRARRGQPVMYGWNGGRHYFLDATHGADVWEAGAKSAGSALHPEQKPLALVQRAIKNSSRPGELVLDLFGGSGTTLIAAEREGRTARVLEIDPVNVDIMIRRYAALGGQTEKDVRATREPALPAKDGAALRPRKKGRGR